MNLKSDVKLLNINGPRINLYISRDNFIPDENSCCKKCDC